MTSSFTGMHLRLISLLIAAILLLGGCGGSRQVAIETGTGLTAPESTLAAADWPVGLPVDAAQPWETVDADGYVIPSSRTTSGINAASEFKAGRDRFNEAGDVTDRGEASRLASGTTGNRGLSWAMYRLEMGGVQPGVVSADVNLLPISDVLVSSYWLGVGNYDAGAWEWYGPLDDGQVRFSLPPADYLTALGNTYVCVVAYDGAKFDVVGIGASPVNSGDGTPPPTPASLTATAVVGGLQLDWVDFAVDDLAGYRVYYCSSWFLDASGAGVRQVPSLQGKKSYLLTGLADLTYVRITAVDTNGNESPFSDVVSGIPLMGTPPVVVLTTDTVSGSRNMVANLTASGADQYDWDLNGDGEYEILNDLTGARLADTSSSGLVRPAVRGSSGGGTALAGAAVSLIVSGNQRPVASAFADPSCGPAPLEVTFTGTGDDPDGTIALYAWDFDGNGIYEWDSTTTGNPPPVTYNTPYLRNVKFRVEDELGAYDIDTVSVLIQESDVWSTQIIDAGEPVTIDRVALAPINGMLGCAYSTATAQLVYIRSKDATGEDWSVPRRMWTGIQPSLCEVNGFPAMAYYDYSTTTCMYVQSTNDLGDVWSSMPTNVITAGSGGGGPCMQIVNGRPAVACHDGTGNVVYVRASDADGAAWPAGSVNVGIGGANTMCLSLAVINGNPAVAWPDSTTGIRLKYARANDVNGGSFLPEVIVDDSTTLTGQYPSLVLVNGRPAIAYSCSDALEIRYARAQDTTGTAWETPVRVNPAGMDAFYCSLAVVDGIPTIAFMNANDDSLMVVRAEDANGTNWGEPELASDNGSAGRQNTIIDNNGRPAVSSLNATWSGIEFSYRTRDY
ncbi:hypothetical protein JW859_04010 [bacterium]|nr:hypothetical protein [bacterium]